MVMTMSELLRSIFKIQQLLHETTSECWVLILDGLCLRSVHYPKINKGFLLSVALDTNLFWHVALLYEALTVVHCISGHFPCRPSCWPMCMGTSSVLTEHILMLSGLFVNMLSNRRIIRLRVCDSHSPYYTNLTF